MLLPAADYNVYRGGTRLPAGDGARPPIGASPGELRLWMKQHGELDKATLAEETRLAVGLGLALGPAFGFGLGWIGLPRRRGSLLGTEPSR